MPPLLRLSSVAHFLSRVLEHSSTLFVDVLLILQLPHRMARLMLSETPQPQPI
jgi:hypothetical protein